MCLLPYNQCHRPGGGLRDGGKVRVKRWGLRGEERKIVNATERSKFEYGICLLVSLSLSPSLFAEVGRKERTGCEGRMRFVIGATSAVCKVALMFAPFVLSRPHLCSLSSIPLLDLARILRENHLFPLSHCFFFSSPYPSYI